MELIEKKKKSKKRKGKEPVQMLTTMARPITGANTFELKTRTLILDLAPPDEAAYKAVFDAITVADSPFITQLKDENSARPFDGSAISIFTLAEPGEHALRVIFVRPIKPPACTVKLNLLPTQPFRMSQVASCEKENLKEALAHNGGFDEPIWKNWIYADTAVGHAVPCALAMKAPNNVIGRRIIAELNPAMALNPQRMENYDSYMRSIGRAPPLDQPAQKKQKQKKTSPVEITGLPDIPFPDSLFE